MTKINILYFLIGILFLSCNKDDSDPKPKPEPLKFEYKLIWSDEFDGSDINRDNWSFEIWNAGWVNNEWQAYVEDDANYKVENGKLHITATQTGGNVFGGYASTRLSSKAKKEFKFGRVEFRAKLPAGRGTWPALWMLGSNQDAVGWPSCGEIDIMEYVGYAPDLVHTNVHTQDDFGSTRAYRSHTLETAEEKFHTYGIIWTKDSIQFYQDNITNIVNTYSPASQSPGNWPFTQKFYMIMNFAVGGTWGGTQGVDGNVWPQTMIVDYVRVYQLRQI